MPRTAVASSRKINEKALINSQNFLGQFDTWVYESAREDDGELGFLDDDPDGGLFVEIVYGKKKTKAEKKSRGEYDTERDLRESVPNSLQMYYKQISKHEPMTREEEIEKFVSYRKECRKLRVSISKLPKSQKVIFSGLYKKFQKNYPVLRKEAFKLPEPHREIFLQQLEACDAVRNEIVQRNLRFVIKIAKSFWKDSNIETFKALISAGNLGLFTAVDKFDLERNIRFLSYAAHWIALEIRLELAADRTVQIPLWWQKLVRKMANVYNTSEKREMTVGDLARKSGVQSKYINMVNNNHTLVSGDNFSLSNYNFELTEQKEFTLQEHELHDEDLIRKEVRMHLQNYISNLPTKEQGVLRLLFGLSPQNRDFNLRQIGDIYNLSSERIRQIKERALETLRENFKALGYQELKDFY